MVGMVTDVGNIRKLNEDYCGYFEKEDYKIYIIADGMGGHNAGEIASRLAVEKTLEHIKSHIDKEENFKQLMQEAIGYSNNEIYNLSRKQDCLNGMGTTITACLITNNIAIVAHVGDSTCYLVNNESITKITKDHSLVQQLIDEGSITENQALHHPNKNIITRAVGTGKNIEVDTYEVQLHKSDIIILCTDGLTNEVTKEEIYDIITNNDNEDFNIICRRLVDLAKVRGGRDNISVLVFGGDAHDWNNA